MKKTYEKPSRLVGETGQTITEVLGEIHQSARRCLPRLKTVLAFARELGVEMPKVEVLIRILESSTQDADGAVTLAQAVKSPGLQGGRS